MTGAPIVTYGLRQDNTVWADAITSHGLEGVSFVAHVAKSADLDIDERSRALRVKMLGRHAVMPALAAVAVGLVEGLGWQEIERGLLAQGRGLRLAPKTGIQGTTLLDDTYNASPTSTLAALDLLEELPGRHLAALGDMLELGSYEVEGHREVGARCAQVLDVLVTVGERARHIAEGALDGGLPRSALFSVPDNESALGILPGVLEEGDILLVKGSRGMAMEVIVQALEESQRDG
jgi:UDP-N-acetylmuramoyl-tripeptide--D-alanyl-D-alanine ligase